MHKLLVLLVCISLGLSVQCADGKPTNKSLIEIVKCLYTSPVISTDVLELIELIKKQEYMKVISYVIKKFPEVKQEVLKCLEEKKKLNLRMATEILEGGKGYWVKDRASCIKCLQERGMSRTYYDKYCNFNCSDKGCIAVFWCVFP